MPTDSSALSNANSFAAPPCSRCGTFVNHAEAVVTPSGILCPACVQRNLQTVRLWPWGYVLGVGVLLNVVVAAVLLAINWQRLGEKDKARNLWIVSAVGTVVVLGLAMLPRGGGIGCGLNLVATLLMARDYKPVWERLKQQGQARASVVWPIVITVAAAVGLGVIAIVGMELMGIPLEE